MTETNQIKTRIILGSGVNMIRIIPKVNYTFLCPKAVRPENVVETRLQRFGYPVHTYTQERSKNMTDRKTSLAEVINIRHTIRLNE